MKRIRRLSSAWVLPVAVLGLVLCGCKGSEPSESGKASGKAKPPGGRKANPAVKVAPTTQAPVVVPPGMAAIKLSLPRPMFKGTPQPVNEPNIEKPLGRPRPPFLAPIGTVNLALDKPVKSSDNEPIIGDMEMVTDGDKEGGDGSFVELAFGKQWVQVDLKAKATIYAIVVWHYHAQARAYRDVIVQIADDRDFITSKTVFNNDHDNSAGMGIGPHKGYVETSEGKLIDSKGVEGRYVRLWSQDSTAGEGNHYIEVAVYGKPAK